MDVKGGLNRILAKAWEILLVSALLAAGVGIGSLMTQYTQKAALDIALAARLVAIFFVIMAFGGMVFSLVARRHAPARTPRQ